MVVGVIAMHLKMHENFEIVACNAKMRKRGVNILSAASVKRKLDLIGFSTQLNACNNAPCEGE